MDPIYSGCFTEFRCSIAQAKNFAFALAIIATLTTLLLGILAYCDVDPFGGIGTLGTQALTYGSAGLAVLFLALKTIDYFYSRALHKEPLLQPIETHPGGKMLPPNRTPLKSAYEIFLQRRVSLSFALTLPPLAPIVTTAPETFLTLDEAKKKYTLPACQYGSKPEIDYFKTTSVPTLLKTVLEGIEHPDQLPLAFDYIKTQISGFKLLTEEKKAREVIDEAAILDPLRKELEGVWTIWRRLLELHQSPFLDPKGLALLHECSDQLPGLSFYAGYPAIQKQLQNLVLAIVCKPTPEQLNESLVKKTLENFSTKLGKEALPSAATLEKDLHSFFTKLFTDIETPFDKRAEGSVPLTVIDAQHLLKYLDTEPKRINQIIHQFIQEHQCMGWSPLENLDYFMKDFTALKKLVSTWRLMFQLVDRDLQIDGKIGLLQLIAENLPNREDEIWKTCGEIKEGMGITLLPIQQPDTFFSNYQFWIDNDGDMQRVANINAALSTIAHKFGSDGSQKFLEIVPDPSNDGLLQEALQAEENEKFSKEQQILQDHLYALTLSQ